MMLLEQLVNYTKRLEQEGKTLPFMYQETNVPWIVKLDAQGNLLEPERTSDGLGKKVDKGKLMPAPKIKRTGAKAALVTDNLEYVFDIPNPNSTPETQSKAAEKRGLYLEELRACHVATGNADVQIVINYLEQQSVPEELLEGVSHKDNVTFMVDGRLTAMQPDVQAFWASKYSDQDNADLGNSKDAPLIAECFISGKIGAVMRREPLPIKGKLIPNGHMAGMGFISADKPAFESYGLRNSEIAPVRTEVAVQYATALNTLLQDPRTHLRVNPVVFAFWTKQGNIPDISNLLRNPSASPLLEQFLAGKDISAALKPEADSTQARKLISSVFSGNVFLSLEPDNFYCVALSAYTSRVVVRNHIQSTLEEVGHRLTNYFESQRLINATLQGVNDLAKCVFRYDKFKKRISEDDVTADVVHQLLGFALEGKHLPMSLLYRLVQRRRIEHDIPLFLQITRAVLTRMTLISLEEIAMDELIALQPNRPDVGYQLGRFMAAAENLQWLALVKYGSSSKINTTVTDRFYGSFSSTPVLVFANIMASAQDHLSRIRKSEPKAHFGEDSRLQQILGYVRDIPEVLEPVQQALFSLGYYHEKADRFARIQEAKDNKENQS
jgi:CRISPR-associated protein Csd1